MEVNSKPIEFLTIESDSGERNQHREAPCEEMKIILVESKKSEANEIQRKELLKPLNSSIMNNALVNMNQTQNQADEEQVECITIHQDPEMMNLPLHFKCEIDVNDNVEEGLDATRLHAKIVVVEPNTVLEAQNAQSCIKGVHIKQESEDLQPRGHVVQFSKVRDPRQRTQVLELQHRHERDGNITLSNAKNNGYRPYRQPKYKCEGCGRGCSHIRTLEAHQSECQQIGKVRETKHEQLFDTKELFCDTQTNGHSEQEHDESLDIKTNSHFLNPEYICCNCEQIFTHLPKLHAHERKCGMPEHQKKPLKKADRKTVSCLHPSCKRKFTLKSSLNHHIKTEHEEAQSLTNSQSNYSCQSCCRTFTYFSTLQTHEKACGKRSKVKKTPCIHPLCKREFFHKCRLIQHIEEDHHDMQYTEPVKGTFRCSKCDREYSHERSLKAHSNMCGKVGKLRKNQCIHSGCTKEFFHIKRMMEHVRRDHPDIKALHPGDGQGLKCQHCGSVYTRLHTLRRHEETCRVGGKLKKTQCVHPSCARKFFHISSMMKHMENDHSDISVDISEKQFDSLTDFKLWKETEETNSFSYFSTRHSVTSESGKSYMCFVCQYSGCGSGKILKTPEEVSTDVGRKQKRCVKTGLVCPARMLVKECDNGTVTVKYLKTHNHEINKNNVVYPPPNQRTFRKYRLSMRESCKNENKATHIVRGDQLDSVEVSLNSDIVSGEMIAEAVMGTGYFDYMVKPNCGYVRTLEKANETIKLYQQRTSSRFICYKVQRSFGKEYWCAENRKILWQHEELRENTLPEFDGIPYILSGTKVMECEYGVNRSAYHKKYRSARRKDEGLEEDPAQGHPSKKVNCPAKIFLKDVIKFPDYKVERNSRQEKKMKAYLLRLALKADRVTGERRIYIQLPEEADHCNHHREMSYSKTPERSSLSAHPHWDTCLSDSSFLNTFRVTRTLFQLLVDEWRKEMSSEKDAVETLKGEMEQPDHQVLAALYYLGSMDTLPSASARFKVNTSRYLEVIITFTDFLLKQSEKYLKWPPVEERVKIAEIIKQECGFPGVCGALDAALVHVTPPHGEDTHNFVYTREGSDPKCAFVFQFIVDHRLIFRDIHLDAPKTGTRSQVYQESSAWVATQNFTSAETHVVAPAVYPLAPALMTPHVTEVLSYQEVLYNKNHSEAHKLTTNAMTVFKSRFRRMQQLSSPFKTCANLIKATCILHNFALMNEEEMALNQLGLEYNSELDVEGWHTVGLEEVVADIGVLGGEEKRRYLTAIMTAQ